jgi:hypothetical protein
MIKCHPTFAFLLSTLMLSNPSYAEWEEMGTVEGETYYIDPDRIRSDDDLVYYWKLAVYDNPQYKWKSALYYNEGDCKIFSVKILSESLSTKQMGDSSGSEPATPSGTWYPVPNSLDERILKRVCDD